MTTTAALRVILLLHFILAITADLIYCHHDLSVASLLHRVIMTGYSEPIVTPTAAPHQLCGLTVPCLPSEANNLTLATDTSLHRPMHASMSCDGTQTSVCTTTRRRYCYSSKISLSATDDSTSASSTQHPVCCVKMVKHLRPHRRPSQSIQSIHRRAPSEPHLLRPRACISQFVSSCRASC